MEIDYDKILKEGLVRYKELEFADIPPEDEIEHNFSVYSFSAAHFFNFTVYQP